MKNKTILATGVLLLFLFFGCITDKQTSKNEVKVIQFKDAECGCCVSHGAYMKGNGFSVDTISTENMQEIKTKYNIPANMQSCHTEIIEGYFVEGHVPVEAINKMLDEKQNIDGIALPRMPAGSPGMPGVKKEPFIIYSIKDGQATEFMRV